MEAIEIFFKPMQNCVPVQKYVHKSTNKHATPLRRKLDRPFLVLTVANGLQSPLVNIFTNINC